MLSIAHGAKDMTQIKRLTQIASLADGDIIPLYDESSKRTRAVLAKTFKEYITGNNVIDIEIVNGELIITKEDGTVINLGPLPIASEAEEYEVLSYDAATGALVGTGVFAKDGEMVVSTSTIRLGGAYSISSGGESVCITNIPKNEHFRIVSHDFLEIGNPKIIVNRLSTGEIIPTPIDADNIVNPDFQYVTPPFLDPAEDGQTVTYADIKFAEGSVKENIQVNIYINDVLFVENFFPAPPEVEPGIHRITYDNPIDIDVGDTFRAVITSKDGDVILKGDANTGVIWQRVTLVCWDYKLTGMHEQDVKTLETDYTNSVLTTKITLEDGEELTSQAGITVAAGGVNVDGVETGNIFTGSGLDSEGDGAGVTIKLTGTEEVVTYNVDDDSTVNLGRSSVGKLISITQTSLAAVPMLFYIDDHNLFTTGDKIHIVASRPDYVNYYFGVYFYSDAGAVDVRYPNDNITLVRTDTNWDVVQQDGPLTRTAIRPQNEMHLPFAEDGDYVRPVKGFVFSEHPAIGYQEDDQGNTVLGVDFYDITPSDPIFKTVAIDTFSSGNPNFTSLIHQDVDLHTLIDATRELRVNVKNIADGALTTAFSVDENQAQFLVQPYFGNDKLALEKDIPDIPSGDYVEKYSRADLDYVRIAYGGKYGDDKTYHPAQISQDSNGWVQEHFTESKVFKFKDKDTGVVGDKILELNAGRVTHHKQPYFNDKKLVAENTSPTFTKLQTQRTTRPDFPPVSIYVDAYYNTIMEANGEFKFRYIDSEGDTVQTLQASETKWNFLVQPKFNSENLVTENSDASFNKVSINGVRTDTAYNNFSIAGSSQGGDGGDGLIFKTYIRADQNPNRDYIQYFGGTGGSNQLANTESVDNAIAVEKAKGEWIGGVLKDTINDDGNPEDDFTCNDPKHWLEYRKTMFNGSFALTVNQGQNLISSEIVIHLHVASGMASAPFKVVTNDGNEVTRTIRVGEKWRFYLRTGGDPYFELIDDGMQSGTTDSDYDGEGFGVPVWSDAGAGTIVQRQITGNYRNTSGELGDLIINLRTDNGVKNFRFYYSLPWNTLDSGRKVYAKVDEKAGQTKTIRPGEMWQCEVKAGQFFDSFFWTKINDGTSSFVLEEDFNSKSGYSKLSSGGGSTHRIEFWENGTIFKLSNSKIEVRLLEGMHDEDGQRHGYVKYINSRGSDVDFEWYDRNGNQIINSTVPSVCPADTVVEIFANYSTDDYAINFSQSKLISSSIAESQEPDFKKFINESSVTVDYPINAVGEQYRPQNIVVTVLDTQNLISGLNVTVTSADSFNGHYNTVGAVSIDSNGEWSVNSKTNAYRLDDGTNTYCVYSDSLEGWVLIVTDLDHNNIGSITGGTPINLYNDGQLPARYGDYTIDNNLDSVESEYFSIADANIDYHTNSGANSYFTVTFGTAKPAGIIFYR